MTLPRQSPFAISQSTPRRSIAQQNVPGFKGALRLLLLTGAITVGLSTPALAQDDTGKVKDTARAQDVISPSGVSYATGAFTYKLPLLSIGGGDFPRSLNYGLWYNSGSARYPNQPWTHNLTVRTSRSLIDDPASEVPGGAPHPEWQTWLHNIVIGQRSESFEKYGASPAGSAYSPVTKSGSSLIFTGGSTTTGYAGYHTYTGGRGEVIRFRPIESSVAPGRADVWTEADGTKLQFSYTAGSTTVENNLGFALLMETPALVQAGVYDQKICVLNLTQHYLPAITVCPAGAPTTIVRSTGASSSGYGELSSAATAAGGMFNFSYSQSSRDGVTRRALNCVKEPGSSICSVNNAYDVCDARFGATDEDPSWTGSRDRVVSQSYPTGETINYVFTSQAGCRSNTQVDATDAANATSVVQASNGSVGLAKDPLLRQSTFTYTGAQLNVIEGESTLIESATGPEGNRTEYSYDARGNTTLTRTKAKPASGLADIVTSATYPTTCDNRVTCNLPASRTDARGGVTDYTYDPVHGGMLTETGPAPASGQPRPQTRLSYAQRSAWISNGSGGFAPAASPVWVLTSKSLCRTSAATGSPSAPCATAGDEVKTTYDYGPESGPNNLLLRGIVEGAGGLNLRTCYGYDNLGRKISETRPRAGVTTCP